MWLVRTCVADPGAGRCSARAVDEARPSPGSRLGAARAAARAVVAWSPRLKDG